MNAVRTARPLRIAHLCNRMANLADGIINVVVDLATAQADAGHEVVVVSAGGDYEPLLHEHGVRTRPFDFSRRTPTGLVRSVLALRRELAAFRPDVVHAHTMTPAVLAAVAAPRSAYRVATVHNEYQRGARLMGTAHAVVCVSHGVERLMATSALSRGRTHVVHNGVVGTPRRPPGVPGPVSLQGPSVLAVGSVGRRKGADVLLEAFGRLTAEPSPHLYFVGNVDEPDLLDRFRGEAWFDRVHLEGRQPDPTPYLHAADVLVVASRRDPHPLALLEGRQAGLAVVGSRVDGIPEGLDHGRAGLLFDAEDVSGLVGHLALLLGDPVARRTWADAATADADEHGVARMAGEYEDLYRARPRRRRRS